MPADTSQTASRFGRLIAKSEGIRELEEGCSEQISGIPRILLSSVDAELLREQEEVQVVLSISIPCHEHQDEPIIMNLAGRRPPALVMIYAYILIHA